MHESASGVPGLDSEGPLAGIVIKRAPVHGDVAPVGTLSRANLVQGLLSYTTPPPSADVRELRTRSLDEPRQARLDALPLNGVVVRGKVPSGTTSAPKRSARRCA